MVIGEESNNTINPRSLYYAQLNERLKKNTDNQSQLLLLSTEASSSPSVETALQLTKEASKPRMQLKEWIELSAKRNVIPVNTNEAKTIDKIGIKKTTPPSFAQVECKLRTDGW